MKKSIDKLLLVNHVRHANAHNKVDAMVWSNGIIVSSVDQGGAGDVEG